MSFCTDTQQAGIVEIAAEDQWFRAARLHGVTLLNTSIITAYGTLEMPRNYQVAVCHSEFIVGQLCGAAENGGGLRSAIGHDGTAALVSELLHREIPVNRIAWTQAPGELGIAFKLRGRPPEGKILTAEQCRQIGWDWVLIL